MDLYEVLKQLSDKHLGPSVWQQQNPRAVCDALLAKAFVEQWDHNGREAYFLIRAHRQLQTPSDNGQTWE